MYRFGEFELDLDLKQLRRGAERLRLERRPFDLLVMLVENHNRMVSREEIVAALWPPKIIIDFDSGLNTLVRKVRHVLGDSPDQPRFIETIPGRGYRFVAPVAVPTDPETRNSRPAAARARRPSRFVPAMVLAALIVAAAAFLWQATGNKPARTRIAILPFENLTGDQNLGYLAAGIAEETNLSLARIDLPNLSVIGVMSARAVADADEPMQAIGRKLGVDFMVLSSLRLDRTRIRVTSRLLRVADGEQIWSASFDRELTNLLGLQRELSVAIAEQIRQRLSPAVAAEIDRRQTQNPEAYELYLKGRYEWTRFQPDSIPRALEYYRQAVSRDPGYALAWAGIAHALITSTVTVEADRESVRPAAEDALQRALEYGPNLAESQLALGSFHLFLDRDFTAAEAAARRAVALDPNSAMCHMFLGMVLTTQQNFVEAREMLRRARELDPLFPLMFANSAVASLMAGEPRDAREFAVQAIAINPEFWVGYLHLGGALYALGDYEGALQAYTQAVRLTGNNSIRASSSRAQILARLGREDEARDILAELIARSTERYVAPFYVAAVYVALGEIDAAFEWFDRGIAGKDMHCLDLQSDQELEILRSDLRFEHLMARCSEPDVAEKIGRISEPRCESPDSDQARPAGADFPASSRC